MDSLDTIIASASQLSTHGTDESRGFRLLSRSLADDAKNALRLFESGDHDGARFLLGKLTNTCFACHSRLPVAPGPELGIDLLADPMLLALPLRDQMTAAVAVRQFETGAQLGEEILATATSPTAIDMTGTIEDYLKIVLRVQGDYSRATTTLARFAERKDLPSYLDTFTRIWIQSMQDIEASRSEEDELDLARGLIQHGKVKNLYPADRRGLIHFIVASSLLHQFVESSPDDKMDLAEAYYLLGIVESSILRSSWSSETEIYLEISIRLAPKSVFAKKAYVFLEEYLISGYTGSAGINVPVETRAHLEELKDLVKPE
jgi:hypothetical protein